jgi:ketosteroid isomerase-like protein
MSQENVEIVRGAFAEFERGNFWVPEIFDPSVRVVWLRVAGFVEETVGLDGMVRAMKEWMQSWEQVTTVAERIIDAGDQVVIIGEWRGRGKASGVLTEWRYGAVYTLRDGKVTVIMSYKRPGRRPRSRGAVGAATRLTSEASPTSELSF